MYSFFDLFGDVGGFYQALSVVGQFTVAGVASRMLVASLIRDLFHVRIDTNKTEMSQLMGKLGSNSKRFQEDDQSFDQLSSFE